MNYTDQKTLIQSLKKGEQQAFIYIVNHYSKRLYGYALTLSNDRVQAQDIIQNIFLRIWEKRDTIDVRTSLQNYLFRGVYNEFLNLYKKQKSTMILEQKYFKSLEKATIEPNENNLKKVFEKMTIEIQKLPPKCREVFTLSRKEGLTNMEISIYLDLSIKTVEAHITKAFSILKKNLDSH